MQNESAMRGTIISMRHEYVQVQFRGEIENNLMQAAAADSAAGRTRFEARHTRLARMHDGPVAGPQPGRQRGVADWC